MEEKIEELEGYIAELASANKVLQSELLSAKKQSEDKYKELKQLILELSERVDELIDEE